MSWSVSAIGKPAAVKAAINENFKGILEQLAKNPDLKHEHAAAALAQETIEGQLNFLIEHELPIGVHVDANGHAYVSKQVVGGVEVVKYGDTNTFLLVKTVPNFVE